MGGYMQSWFITTTSSKRGPVLYDHIRLFFHFVHLEKIEVTIEVQSILNEAASITLPNCSERAFSL